MHEYLLLGLVQGITEWLPVSSEGVVVLLSSHLLSISLSEAVRLALFLHLGTFFAALIYLRGELWRIGKTLQFWSAANEMDRHMVRALSVATLATALVALPLLVLIDETSALVNTSATIVGLIVGIPLMITGYLSLYTTGAQTNKSTPTLRDSLITGLAQGLAIIPGISRSGITVATLLLRNVDESTALRFSFLLSLPVVLGGNILLNMKSVSAIGAPELIALATSFMFGYLTIHALLKIARHVSFGWFTFFAGALLVFAALL